MSAKTLYRIMFVTQETFYEIYARELYESSIFGFLEIEELVFGESSSVVIDPADEKLKLEFSNVKKTFIPITAIHRIDVVTKEGLSKVRALSGAKPLNILSLADKK